MAYGVCAYQPTLITAGEADLIAALGRVRTLAARPTSGASIIGVHLEGPFLSPERAGTHPIEHLRAPDIRLLERLLNAGPVRMMTIAAELPGADELIAMCVKRGVTVSLGHSCADADVAARAFRAGARAVTHVFNAMDPMSARAPGLAGAALATDGVTVQLIADGIHVADDMIRVAFAAARGRCSLVSDAMAALACGTAPIASEMSRSLSSDGVARRADGTLAGSVARLVDGLTHLIRIGVDLLDAIDAVSACPARLLGTRQFGFLRRGARADLLVIDEDGGPQRVVIAGCDQHSMEPAA